VLDAVLVVEEEVGLMAEVETVPVVEVEVVVVAE